MDCIDLFKRAAVALQTDPRYLALDQARKANDNDENLQNLIGEFNLARMDLNNEIGKSERDDARITELNEKVNNLYGQIMGDEGMTAYNEAKRECENLVNYIDAIINTAMNGGDPMTVHPPAAAATNTIRNKTRLCNADRVLFAKGGYRPQTMHRTIERGERENHGRAVAHDAAISGNQKTTQGRDPVLPHRRFLRDVL